MAAANLCPAFRAVTERFDELTTDIDSDCSVANRTRFSDLLELARQRVAAQLGGKCLGDC